MWGSAVNLAHQAQRGPREPGIFVTSAVYEAMRDVQRFVAAGEVTVGTPPDTSTEPIWRLLERSLMAAVLSAPWFYWAVGIAVGLPVLLVLLTEIAKCVAAPQQHLARPVTCCATIILPFGALLLLMTEARQEPGHEHPGADRRDALRLRGAGAAALGAERDAVPGRARRQLAQTHPVDLPRRGTVRADRGRPRDDLLLHLGRQRRRLVHRAGYQLDRPRSGIAELGGPDHLRAADAVRAAVPVRATGSTRRRPEAGWSK